MPTDKDPFPNARDLSIHAGSTDLEEEIAVCPHPRDRTAHNPGGQVTDYDNGEPITIWPPTTIQQTARERLSELIRAGGIAWKEANDPDWRGKPWMDGVLVDVDESDVVDAIVDRIITGSDPDAPASSAPATESGQA